MIPYQTEFTSIYPQFAWIYPINKYLIFLLVLFVGLYIWIKFRDKFLDYLAALTISQAIVTGLKMIIKIPRPVIGYSDYSFPSGHTAIAFTSALFLIFACRTLTLKFKRAGDGKQGESEEGKVTNVIVSLLLIFTAIVVAVLRVVVKAHYPVDVFAGIILAILVTLPFRYYDVSTRRMK
ncbi:hypothetical protein CO178_01545 [candidate division WWE3 bacterium CG_4_9_14_3_um_filter_34_6]|uniref:Phosphatidic acid phosphatase type 2/haloperoxidase domain-containing protein n=1 Tax=candidate division WWE3 bacterium CG_4_9_14_3_um_filter_34_6 TaxID=1975079 RepID=A0A2M7X3L6_UNCKA|nr:MAG: hypothetical protein CO178_01545 [candidate division WWE3 bacterium CG_4_9_14_3_um_filter_34_6]